MKLLNSRLKSQTIKRFFTTEPSNTHKFPDAVLFSNSVLFPQRLPTGFLIHLFAKQNQAVVPKDLLEILWYEVSKKRLNDTPLYTPGTPLTRVVYKKWIMDTVKIVLNSVSSFNSPLRDTQISESIQYRVYKELISGKSYSLPQENLQMLTYLKENEVPFGIVANGSPFFTSILTDIQSRLSTPVLKINDSWIPFVNAADDGVAKPDPKIILKLLKQMKTKNSDNVYYIGNDPQLDTAPSKALGLKSVLLTKDLPTPKSDLKYLSARLSKEKTNFRVCDIRELERVFFPKDVYKKAFHPRKNLYRNK